MRPSSATSLHSLTRRFIGSKTTRLRLNRASIPSFPKIRRADSSCAIAATPGRPRSRAKIKSAFSRNRDIEADRPKTWYTNTLRQQDKSPVFRSIRRMRIRIFIWSSKRPRAARSMCLTCCKAKSSRCMTRTPAPIDTSYQRFDPTARSVSPASNLFIYRSPGKETCNY